MIVWLNPVSGVSGDMLLGALLDLGAPLAAVRTALDGLQLPGWDLAVDTVDRQGLRALHAQVRTSEDVAARPASVLIDLVSRARPEPVAAVATRAVRLLAEVEARIHDRPVDDVHLHELGGLDTVIDTVGVAAAVHALGITDVYSAPIALGTGTIASAHGLLPVPAPATLALLDGAQVHGAGPVGETVTPTGAALLAALGCRYEPLPPMTVQASGYGAGTRDPAGRPNVLPAVLGRPARAVSADGSAPDGAWHWLALLETTVDDVTGEEVGTLLDALLDAGALDVWTCPATGKKSRPALVISVLAEPGAAGSLTELLALHTGTLGVRHSSVDRIALPRRTVTVEIDGCPVRVKVGPYRAKPERDDVVAVARTLGLAPAVVAARALDECQRFQSSS